MDITDINQSRTRDWFQRGSVRMRSGRPNPKEWALKRDAQTEQISVLTDVRLPHLEPLNVLEATIQRSVFIRDLTDDWDEQGSSGVKPETWDRAVRFLRASADIFLRDTGAEIDTPSIFPGPDGTVDLHWKSDAFMLLINIRQEGSSDFYGEAKGGLSVKGTFMPEIHHQGILSWLKERSRP